MAQRAQYTRGSSEMERDTVKVLHRTKKNPVFKCHHFRGSFAYNSLQISSLCLTRGDNVCRTFISATCPAHKWHPRRNLHFRLRRQARRHVPRWREARPRCVTAESGGSFARPSVHPSGPSDSVPGHFGAEHSAQRRSAHGVATSRPLARGRSVSLPTSQHAADPPTAVPYRPVRKSGAPCRARPTRPRQGDTPAPPPRRRRAGTYTWADGSKYVGEFRNGARQGRGKPAFATPQRATCTRAPSHTAQTHLRPRLTAPLPHQAAAPRPGAGAGVAGSPCRRGRLNRRGVAASGGHRVRRCVPGRGRLRRGRKGRRGP